MKLSELKPNAGAREKRTRVGRGHGSGLVKTSGKGGKGQTVRSGGGKGPNFEGGQTPYARRLPQRRGVSQKARSTSIFRTHHSVLNLANLADWDVQEVVSPDSLHAKGLIKKRLDGVKILAVGEAPKNLKFQQILFSAAARAKLEAAGASFEE